MHTAMSTLYCKYICSQMPQNMQSIATGSLVMPEGQTPLYNGAEVNTDANAMWDSKWQKLVREG